MHQKPIQGITAPILAMATQIKALYAGYKFLCPAQRADLPATTDAPHSQRSIGSFSHADYTRVLRCVGKGLGRAIILVSSGGWFSDFGGCLLYQIPRRFETQYNDTTNLSRTVSKMDAHGIQVFAPFGYPKVA